MKRQGVLILPICLAVDVLPLCLSQSPYSLPVRYYYVAIGSSAVVKPSDRVGDRWLRPPWAVTTIYTTPPKKAFKPRREASGCELQLPSTDLVDRTFFPILAKLKATICRRSTRQKSQNRYRILPKSHDPHPQHLQNHHQTRYNQAR